MMYRTTRRGVAAGAATALAIGTLTIFGTSVANAAPVVRDWADGKTSFNRTISNGTPGVGETITVTTKFRRTDNITETINWITDVNPPCLTYVAGSAKVNGNPVTPAVNPNRGGTPPSGTVTVSGLTLVNAPGTNNPSYSVDYKVGANCALGTTLQTGMDYSGDRGAGYYGFGGPNITAGKGNPATALGPVVGARVGQSTTLTATVTGGGSASGNPVEFYDGATKIGQGNLDAAGNVTLAWTPATAGGHSLTAKFLGTATANLSVSAAQNVTVTPADVTTTTAVTGPATAVAGADVTLDVQVSPVPSGGTVQFKDGATNIGGPVTLGPDGKGSITQQFAAGARSITAVYAGAGEFLTSTSAAHNVTVTPANVDTTTTVTGDTTGVVGSDVALSVNVSPAPAGGTVQFKNGADDIGTPVNLDAAGNASISVPLAAGAHAITAVYSGFNEHQGSTSGAHNVTVTPANVDTTTTVTGDTTGVVGSDVALSVNVSPAPAGGTVQFKNGADDIGTPVNLDAAGNASISVPLAAGAHAITAVYSGFNEHQGSTSGAHNVTVTPANVDTTTAVTGDTTGVVGSDVALSVNVSPAPAGGTVQFKNGADDIGTPVNLDAAGNASISVPLAAGAHAITAVYSGFNEHQGSTSGAHNVTVTPANVDTTTTVTGDTTGVVGSDVALSVNVSPAPAGGTVQFKNGADDIGAPVTLDDQGNGTIAVPLAEGSHVITAVYSGFGEHQGSTSVAHNVTVTQPAATDEATTTVLTLPVDVKAGVAVNLVATVSPSPTGGTVQFKNGGTDIGLPVGLTNGKATRSYIFPTVGDHQITAVYTGTAGFLGSDSDVGTVSVGEAPEPDSGSASGSLGSLFGSS